MAKSITDNKLREAKRTFESSRDHYGRDGLSRPRNNEHDGLYLAIQAVFEQQEAIIEMLKNKDKGKVDF